MSDYFKDNMILSWAVIDAQNRELAAFVRYEDAVKFLGACHDGYAVIDRETYAITLTKKEVK